MRRRLLIKYANGTNDKSDAPTDTDTGTGIFTDDTRGWYEVGRNRTAEGKTLSS